MKITTKDFNDKLTAKLMDLGIVNEEVSGYSSWYEVEIDRDKIREGLENLLNELEKSE